MTQNRTNAPWIALGIFGLVILVTPFACCGSCIFMGMIAPPRPTSPRLPSAPMAAENPDPLGAPAIAKKSDPLSGDVDLAEGYVYDQDTKTFVYNDRQGNKVHVSSYIRKDGTVVRAHDRALPGDGIGKGSKGGGKGGGRK
jgi:hypothetical protein